MVATIPKIEKNSSTTKLLFERIVNLRLFVNYQYYLKSTYIYSLLGTISALFVTEKRSLTKLTFVLRITAHSMQISAPI
jgi:hypothetical protein